jgi:hypothetical protein
MVKTPDPHPRRRRQSFGRHEQVPTATPTGHEHGHEKLSPGESFVQNVAAFLGSGGESDWPVLASPNALADDARIEREMAMEGLSEVLGFNVEAALDQAEVEWVKRGNDAVLLESWMKPQLHIDNPDRDLMVKGGSKRQIPCAVNPMSGSVMLLTEIFVPGQNVGPDGSIEETSRSIIYMHPHRLIYEH